jgi:DNA-binding transcriptional MerR regulator
LGTFSIKDVEAVSGIKCHTLRIWEQRYGILCPKRTGTNIRYYDDEDLKYVLNISILNRQGYKISEIAKMDRAQINEAVINISCKDTQYQCQINSLIAAMLVFDEFGFHQILNKNILQLGLDETMLRIVFPFLVDAGLLWQVGSIEPAHEHFVSHIIKQKLYVAIEGNVGRYAQNRKCFLLFLPEHEQHCISLLFANYILRSRGHDVLYLGQEVPLKHVCTALGKCPDYVLTIMMSASADVDRQSFVNALGEQWSHSKILLGGAQFLQPGLRLPGNAMLLETMDGFIAFVDELTGAPAEAVA